MLDMNKIEHLSRRVDSDLLRTFVAVADFGGVSKAGRQIGRTQSAVSVQIRKLERALDTALFSREARGVRLTDSGLALLPLARSVLVQLDRIGSYFAAPLVGRIRIGIPDDYGSALLERILAGFSACHPQVEVSMRFGNSGRFPEALDDGGLDLAVYAATAPEEGGTMLMTERTVWAAGPDWPSPSPVPLPLALFDQSCWWREAAIDALAAAGTRYRVAVTSESVSGVKAAVRAGLSVAMLAEAAVEPDMRILKEKDGFPALPASALILRRSRTATAAPALEMERAIVAGFLGGQGRS